MSLFVLDTDCLSLHAVILEFLSGCAAQQPGEVVITVISLEEQLSGWYRLLRQVKQPDDLARTYQNLIDTD